MVSNAKMSRRQRQESLKLLMAKPSSFYRRQAWFVWSGVYYSQIGRG